jgi:hypothetical protein
VRKIERESNHVKRLGFQSKREKKEEEEKSTHDPTGPRRQNYSRSFTHTAHAHTKKGATNAHHGGRRK